MISAWLASAVLAASPADAAADVVGVEPAAGAVLPESPVEWRNAVREALRSHALAEGGEKLAAAVRLVALYDGLGTADRLDEAFRRRLRGKLAGRLKRTAEQVKADLEARGRQRPDAAAEAAAVPQDVLAQFIAGDGGAPAGGDAIDRAGWALVDLIQSTIEPGHWDVNGGPGHIHFWRNGLALIVTATDEVHEKIGGLAR